MKTLIPIGWLLLALSIPAAMDVPEAHADGETERTRVVRFKISGMVTDNCPVLVKEAVRRIDGVKNVRASLETKRVDVTYVQGRTSPEAIRKVIEDKTGFDAEVEHVR
ncbi:MAG: heavy-metal-associated domain-containing protein [Myxococcota bacterium]